MQQRPAWFVAVAALAATLAVTAASAQPPQGRGGRRRRPRPGPAGPIAPGSRGMRAAISRSPPGTASVSGHGGGGRHRPTGPPRPGHAERDRRGRLAHRDDRRGRALRVRPARGRPLQRQRRRRTGTSASPTGRRGPDAPARRSSSTDGQKFAANLQLPRGSVITGTVVDEYGEATAGHPGAGAALRDAGRPANAAAVRQRHHRRSRDLPRLRPPAGRLHRLGGAAECRAVASTWRACRPSSPRCANGSRRWRGGCRRRPRARDPRRHAPGPAAASRGTGDRLRAGLFPRHGQPPARPGTITLNIGEERASVDFQLVRVPLAHIEGTVVNSTGQAIDNVQLTLTDAAPSVPGASRWERGPTPTAASASPTFPRAAIG